MPSWFAFVRDCDHQSRPPHRGKLKSAVFLSHTFDHPVFFLSLLLLGIITGTFKCNSKLSSIYPVSVQFLSSNDILLVICFNYEIDKEERKKTNVINGCVCHSTFTYFFSLIRNNFVIYRNVIREGHEVRNYYTHPSTFEWIDKWINKNIGLMFALLLCIICQVMLYTMLMMYITEQVALHWHRKSSWTHRY